MVDAIGIAGSVLLALCAVPLVWEALIKRSIRMNSAFLTIWTLGELFTFIYVYGDWILMLNYGANLLLLAVVWRYKTNEQ